MDTIVALKSVFGMQEDRVKLLVNKLRPDYTCNFIFALVNK